MYMVVAQSQTLSSKQEMLDALAESLVLPDRFAQVGNSYVGTEPLKSSSRFSHKNLAYVNNDGVIIRLDLPEQLYLYEKAGEQLGIKARLGSLHENLIAAHSKEAIGYRKSVLDPYCVFTGEVIRRLGKKYDVSRAVGAEFVKTQSADILLERDGQLLEIEGSPEKITPKIKLGPALQTTIPTKTGYYTDLSGTIPVDTELESKTKQSKGYFGRTYFDKQGLSAVWSYWNSVGGVFDAGGTGVDAYWPLYRYGGGVLGVWTDENPKK